MTLKILSDLFPTNTLKMNDIVNINNFFFFSFSNDIYLINQNEKVDMLKV